MPSPSRDYVIEFRILEVFNILDAMTGVEFMQKLYQATAPRNCRPVNVCPELYPYAAELYGRYQQPVERVTQTGRLIRARKEKRDIELVALSGGKDSLAMLLKHLEPNKAPECYYVNGINHLDPAEQTYVKSISSTLGVTLHTIEFSSSAKLWLPESIIKNQMIYALVMDSYPGLPKEIGFGYTRNVGPQSMAFFHDSMKSFDLFHEFAVQAWGPHDMMEPLEDEVESFTVIREKAPPALSDNLASCMSREEDKAMSRRELQNRFGILLSNRYSCGLCYKCAEKAIIEHDFFNVPYPDHYLKECRKILLDKANATIAMNGYPLDYLKKLNCV